MRRGRDQEYLEALDRHLPTVVDRAAPEIVFSLAGVNLAAEDRHGTLALSDEGIRAGDRMVIAGAAARYPFVILSAGGYDFTAELHAHVFWDASVRFGDSISKSSPARVLAYN